MPERGVHIVRHMPDGRYVEGAVCRLERSFVAHFGCDQAGSEISRMPRFPTSCVCLYPMSMRPFPVSGSPIIYSHAALRRLVGRRRDTSEHLSFHTGTQVLSRSGSGTHSALRSLPARRAARSVPRATIDVGDRGMALPHIREDCAWTQGSHHTHQWLVSVWGILNFSSSIIVWRSTGLFRAGVSDLCQTFLHRLHVAT